MEEKKEDKVKIVQGELCQERLEWLKKSIISKTIKPMNFSMVADRIENKWFSVTNVRKIRAYKALLTFDSIDRRNLLYWEGLPSQLFGGCKMFE